MSKKAKSQAKDKRRSLKRSRKAAQRTQYESWAREGQNKKSKRNRIANGRARTVRLRSHPDGACGNLGCLKCNKSFNNPWMVSTKSCVWGKRYTSSRWRSLGLSIQ